MLRLKGILNEIKREAKKKGKELGEAQRIILALRGELENRGQQLERREAKNRLLSQHLDELKTERELNLAENLQLRRELEQTKQKLTETKETLERINNRYTDPVQFTPLREPVALSCGHVLNRSTIEELRRNSHTRCPCCRAVTSPETDRKIHFS